MKCSAMLKKNRNDMVKLQTKTEHLEQSFLMERSLEKNASIDTSVLEFINNIYLFSR